LIPNQWYAVLDSGEVREEKPVGVTRLGERLVFWRSKDKIACIRDQCVHRGAALSAGKVVDGLVVCPFHGLRYDSTGKVKLIPANGKAATVPEQFHTLSYPARDEHGFIWIWYGEQKLDYPQLPWFSDIDNTFAYGTSTQHWKTHYSRAIENQLDVAHLPFVHYNTIGRGNKTVINGPYTTLTNDTISVYPDNEVDIGQSPKKVDEFTSPPHDFFIQFKFPNIWQNRISSGYRIVATFTPIDQENTLMYLRNYRKGSNLPLLKQVADFIGNRGNQLIAGQDRRVVQTQIPKRSELHGGEKLLQADRPIVLYRTRREQLIEAGKR
jgi:phenylpropionate dioxygenase-like ring-hydroxylating dioxygenase large terminal subunit